MKDLTLEDWLARQIIKKNSRKKRRVKTMRLVSTVLISFVAILAFMVAVPRMIGYIPFSLLSGSMEPAYPVGSLIYVQTLKPEKIQIGDTITFVSDKNLVVVTHRVTRIDNEKQYFYTKGDANNTEDPNPVFFPNLIGRPVLQVPLLGYLSAFISMHIREIFISILLLLIILYIPNLIRWSRRDYSKKAPA